MSHTLQNVLINKCKNDSTPTTVLSLTDRGSSITYLDGNGVVDMQFRLFGIDSPDFSEDMSKAIKLGLVGLSEDTGVFRFKFPCGMYVAYWEEFMYVIRKKDLVRLYYNDDDQRCIQHMVIPEDKSCPKDAVAFGKECVLDVHRPDGYFQDFINYILGEVTVQ